MGEKSEDTRQGAEREESLWFLSQLTLQSLANHLSNNSSGHCMYNESCIA